MTDVYNDDPGSGLYHFGIAVQKDKILPTIVQIASSMGVTVSDADQATIAANIQSASFPAFETWISQSSQTINRIGAKITRGGAQPQSFTFDVSLLPLVGNPPAIAAPDSAIPLAQILNPAQAPASTSAAAAKKAPAKK